MQVKESRKEYKNQNDISYMKHTEYHMDNVKSARIECIDLMKVIAIFFVLTYHTKIYSCDFLNNDGILMYIRYFSETILSTCVPLFFFANGFLILNQKFNLKKHIIKSIRLVYLTFLWGSIDLLLLMLIENNPLTIKDFVISLLSWKQGWINHLWYMGALICIYILFPLIKEVYDNNKKIYYYFVLITAIFTFGNTLLNEVSSIAANYFINHLGVISMNWFNMFNPYIGIYGYSFVYFCIGGSLKDIMNIIESNRKKSNTIAFFVLIISMALLFILGIVMSRLSGEIWDVVWYGYDTIFTFLNVISIFILVTNYKGENKKMRNIVTTISCNTLGIYYIHVVYIHLIRPHMLKINFMSNIVGDILFSMLILITSMITVLFIKRIRILKHLLL